MSICQGKTGIEDNIQNIVKIVIEHYKWEPAAIGRLFWDREDWNGLVFWYDHIKEMKR